MAASFAIAVRKAMLVIFRHINPEPVDFGDRYAGASTTCGDEINVTETENL